MSDLIKVPMKNFYEDIFTHSFPHHSFIHFFFFFLPMPGPEKCQRKDNESGTFLPSEGQDKQRAVQARRNAPRTVSLSKRPRSQRPVLIPTRAANGAAAELQLHCDSTAREQGEAREPSAVVNRC